jgi:hypothetical protein
VIVRQVRHRDCADFALRREWPTSVELPASGADGEAETDRKRAGRPTAIGGEIEAHDASIGDSESGRPVTPAAECDRLWYGLPADDFSPEIGCYPTSYPSEQIVPI